MGPVIGLTCSHDMQNDRIWLARNYTRAVEAAGGIPLLLDYSGNAGVFKKLVNYLDGVILTGGVDVDPVFFDQEPSPACGEIDPERDCFEMELTRLFLSAGLPVLGICRGMQVLNIAAGGDIYQDIYSGSQRGIQHRQQAPRWHPTHDIEVVKGTLLERITGGGKIRVNSFHHQAVRKIAPGFIVSARSSDGVVEGIERPDLPFVVGIQCHPETMWPRDKLFLSIFQALVRAAACRGDIPS
ncbi:para-aminobenzoate synthase [Desulfocucumis palustris]|uniref:Para-aminobenzoate synthase n=1 Tax=Desulfocucumis palustris TaxID=1898651 RepID=A0A2L2X7R9_9FIRM|nr:gamma-glutamyl-gamma-aminobutyrate hydrolase family protein [Desulfocucumis palustris]GBF32239.1 para-aminobenzoate synthase [Desulfocucumis palustris]